MSAIMARTIVVFIAFILTTGANAVWAGDILKITIPKRSELTVVQRLNREGVEAVKKHQYARASKLFYKAYLFDPADPFTLNNLGYISELYGDLEHANGFYALSAEQVCSANIDRSNVKQLEGKPLQYAYRGLQDLPMRVNRMNVDAMTLLSQKRGLEAVTMLQKAMTLDKQNPFTLNNLGVAEESIGNYYSALRFYTSVAEMHSTEPSAVTKDRVWRGRSVSVMAAASARRLATRIKEMDGAEVNVLMLSSRGVSATNQNDLSAARKDFLKAYTLDPSSAFTLNNRGYVAEMDGDMESAQIFYEKARKASGSDYRVGLATRLSEEGKKLSNVADTSAFLVDGKLRMYSLERHRQTGPIELTPHGTEPGEGSRMPLIAPSTTDAPPLR